MSSYSAAMAKGPARWSDVSLAPPNAIFHLNTMYKADTHPKKANLGIGAYRDDDGQPVVLNSVRKAEALYNSTLGLEHDKEYLPISGNATFTRLSAELLVGADNIYVKEDRVASIQSLSGTGALSLGAMFLSKHGGSGPVFIPHITWANHQAIYKQAGFTEENIFPYRYYRAATRDLDFDGMIADLSAAPFGASVLLHLCAHNPTGVDPSSEQWDAILDVCQKRNLYIMFDSAYQGFASGDLVKDGLGLNKLLARGMECMVFQSFSKNMGLYGERTGCCHVFCPSADIAAAVKSQLCLIVRPMYSNPPGHGAFLVAKILGDPALRSEWHAEVKGMADTIQVRRDLLYKELKRLKTPGNWDHVINQIGMFSFTGLSPEQVAVMISKHHIYMLNNGRISCAGLTTKNIAHVAASIHDVVTNYPSKM